MQSNVHSLIRSGISNTQMHTEGSHHKMQELMKMRH